MSKSKNYYYGISVDGLLLNVAEFERSNNRITLSRIESYKMDKPLYTEYANETTSDLELSSHSLELDSTEPQKEIDIDKLDSIPDSLFDEEPTEKMMDFDSVAPSKKTENAKLEPSQSTQSNEVYQFFSKFFFDSGKISISSIDTKTQWKVVKTSEKVDFNKLKKLALTPEQIKDESISFSYVQNQDNSYYAITHQGEFELMSLLKSCGKMIYNSKRPFFYQFIQPNEISFLNIYNLFYSFDSNKYATLLYIGEETKFGMVVKDKKIVKLFPIMIFDMDPQRVRESVYAKLLLEQENFDFSITENIFLAGTYAKDEDIQYYNKKTGHTHSLFSLDNRELKKLKLDLQISSQVDESNIPAFIIPISLALKGILQKHKDTCKFNLLSKKDADARKTLKLAWHGYFIMLLVFAATVVGTMMDLNLKHITTQKKYELSNVTNELNTIQNFVNTITGYQMQIASIHETHSRSAKIDSEKNSWSEVLYKLSDFANRNPLIWVEDVSTQTARFTIKGKSYHRDRITTLAQLFEDGNITRISEGNIAGHTIWDFEINYKRPIGELPVQIPLPTHLATFENFREHTEELQRRATPPPAPIVATVVPTPIDVVPMDVVEAPSDVVHQNIAPDAPPTSFAFINDTVDSATLFNMAQDSYMSNSFNDAIALLDNYLHKFPEGAEIAQAKYLLGEIYFILNSFNRAIEFFEGVYRLQREKVPESLFFMARSYELINDYQNAIRFYTILANDFASSPLARTAQEHLNIISGGQR